MMVDATAGHSDFFRAVVSGQNRFLLRVAAVAAIGGFLFGYDTGVIGGALLYIKRDLHAGSSFDQQAIVSSLLVGAVVGAVAAGRLAGLLGRRRTLIAAGWIYVVGGLGSVLSQSVWQLVGRVWCSGLRWVQLLSSPRCISRRWRHSGFGAVRSLSTS